MSNLIQKIKQFFQPRAVTIRLPGGGLIISLVVGMAVIITGYGLIKNIKSSTNQSASAEQLPGTPESGARSRITELYDALVAQNKGSDTDVSGLTAAQGDWGAKWNRIKTAALKGNGNTSTLGAYSLSSDPQVSFVDNLTGKQWSFPLYREGSQVKSGLKESLSNTLWSWDSSAANNQAVGNKTAIQLCQALGNSWRLPTREELSYVYHPLGFARPSGRSRWSSTDYSPNSAYSVGVNNDGGITESVFPKSDITLVVCVR